MQKALEIAIILAAVDRMTAVVNKATNNASAKFAGLQKTTGALATKAFSTGRDLATMGLVAGAALAYPIKAAAEFETGLANIRKVTNGLNDPLELAKMGKELRTLSGELPIAQSELLDLVAAGGRMGIAKEELVDYTRLVSKMAVAFDAPADKIGEDMGKLAVVFKIPINGIGKLADAVNFLDDNAIAKGPDIIEVMRRVGGIAQQVGLAAPNVAALASTFLTLGANAETAGTASAAIIRQLAIATVQPKRFQAGLVELGLNAKKIQDNMSIDPQNTILGVLDKINALPQNKQVQVTTQLFGKEYGPTTALLAKGIGEYRRQLELLNNARLSGSVQREFDIRQKTAAAQWQETKNKMQSLAVVAGTALLPILARLTTAVTPLIDKFAAWVENNQSLVASIGTGLAALAAISLAGSGISFMIGGVAKTISMLSGAFSFLTKGVGLVIKVFNILRIVALTNPVLLIIALIAGAVYLIYKNWDTIVPFFKNLWEKVKGWFVDAWEWIKKMFLNYSLPGLIIKHWGDITGVLSKFYDAGKNIMLSLWNGIKSLAMKPVEAIQDIVGKMRDYLPFSPAKVGPFRDLHKVKIVETIAATIKAAPLVNAMQAVTTKTAQQGFSGGISGRSTGGSLVLNYAPVINMGVGGDKNDLLAALRQHKDEVLRWIRDAEQQRARASF